MRRAMWKHLSKLGSHFSFCMLRIIQVLHCQIPPAPQALRAALVISKKAYTVRLQTLHLRSYLVSPLPRNPLTITQALMEASCSPRHPDTSTIMERVAGVNDTEIATVTGGSSPPISYTSQPDEVAKVPDTSTASNAMPPLVSPAYDNGITPAVSMEFVTTAEETEASVITTAFNASIIKMDEVAEASLTFADTSTAANTMPPLVFDDSITPAALTEFVEGTEAPMTTTASDTTITKTDEVAEAP